MKRFLAVMVPLALAGCAAPGVQPQTPAGPAPAGQIITSEWANVKAPPAPELKAVKVAPNQTALLMLDFVKQSCGARPRCVAALPNMQRLLAQARSQGVLVVHSLAGQTPADIYPEVAARQGEPVVSSGPNKFLNTDLERILADHGIKTVIVAGTASEGAVLNTGAHAALRGMKVVVPVDGQASSTLYAEQYTVWHLANAPRIGPQVTVTRSDMIGF
jgi:nicotinamidase-related amidase